MLQRDMACCCCCCNQLLISLMRSTFPHLIFGNNPRPSYLLLSFLQGTVHSVCVHVCVLKTKNEKSSFINFYFFLTKCNRTTADKERFLSSRHRSRDIWLPFGELSPSPDQKSLHRSVGHAVEIHLWNLATVNTAF